MKLWYDIILWHITEIYASVNSACLPKWNVLKNNQQIHLLPICGSTGVMTVINQILFIIFPPAHAVSVHCNNPFKWTGFSFKGTDPTKYQRESKCERGGGGGREEISDGMKR